MTTPSGSEHGSSEPGGSEPGGSEPAGSDAPFDPYRFGRPEQPVPPEYAPPGYTPPPAEPANPYGQPYGSAPPPYGAPPPNAPSPYGPSSSPYGPSSPYGQAPGQPYQPYPGYGAPPPTGYHGYAQQPTGNGKAVTSLVLGIASILLFWLTFFDGIFIVLALIFGIIGLNDAKSRGGHGRGMAVGGLVCTAIGAVAATIFTAVIFHVAGQCGGFGNNNDPGFNQCVQNHF